MGKRFTDTDKWKDAWFTDLEPAMKIFWVYICDNCDHAGIWRVNFKIASSMIGAILDRQSVMNALGKRIRVLSDDKWYIEKFISFQYPKGLSPKCKPHIGVISLLKSHSIDLNPYLTVQDKDKDKDKDILPSSFSSSKNEHRKKNLPEKDSQLNLKVDHVEELFNQMLAGVGSIKHCRMLSGEDRQNLLQTIAFPQFSKLENWKELFEIVKASAFLTGQNGSNFVVTLNWLSVSSNASKVLNGQYSGLNKLNSKQSSNGNPYIKQLHEKYGNGEPA
jgi:hypothetical protein